MDFVVDPEEEQEYNLIYGYIDEHGGELYRARDRTKKQRCKTAKGKPNLWQTSWGQMLRDPAACDLASVLSIGLDILPLYSVMFWCLCATQQMFLSQDTMVMSR